MTKRSPIEPVRSNTRPARCGGTRRSASIAASVSGALTTAIVISVASAIATPASAHAVGARPAAFDQETTAPPATRGSDEALALLARLEDAMGGRAAIEAIPGVRMEMTVRVDEEDPNPVKVSVVRAKPFAARIRQSGGGRTASEIGFDGELGWMSDGQGGHLELNADHARDMMQGADLQAMLRDLRTRFERFDADPPTEFRGKQVLVLRCAEEDASEGDSVRVFLDPTTVLPVGMESVVAGEERDVNRVIFEGWRDERGVKVFSKMTIDRGPIRSLIVFDRIAFEAIPAGDIRSPLAEKDAE
jgi:hypothetical protein